MITNEYQYKISKSNIKKFQKLIDELRNSKENLDSNLIKTQIEAIQSQINDIKEEISQYENIKNNEEVPIDELLFFKNIPISLIKARIGLNMTQKEFADLLGVKEQQIQRWESTEYASVSISRVHEIIKIILKSKNINLKNIEPLNKILKRLSEIGLNKDFIINRFSTYKDISEKDRKPKVSSMNVIVICPHCKYEDSIKIPRKYADFCIIEINCLDCGRLFKIIYTKLLKSNVKIKKRNKK